MTNKFIYVLVVLFVAGFFSLANNRDKSRYKKSYFCSRDYVEKKQSGAEDFMLSPFNFLLYN